MLSGARPPRYGADATVTYTGKRWSAYATADYRRFDINGFRGGLVRTQYGDTLTYLPSAGARNLMDEQYALRLGGSYAPDARSSLNVGLYAGYKQTDRTANLYYDDFINVGGSADLYGPPIGQPFRQFYNQNQFSRTGTFQTLNADYTRTFADKSKLTVLGLYEYSVLGGPLRNTDQTLASGEFTLRERAEERSPLTAWRGQVDWVKPFAGNRRLEAGYQFRRVRHDGDFSFERLNLSSGQWVSDPAFADRMALSQQIHGGYVQWNTQGKRFSYNAGLRLEYTDRTLTHDAGPAPYLFQVLNLFPSLQGLWTLSSGQTLRFGYNRRIDRPTTKALSPFKNHRHAEAIELGDPTLRPELTDVLEGSYSRGWGKFTLTMTGYVNRTQDRIFRVNAPYSCIVLLRLYTNAGVTTSVGGEFSGEWKPLSWWRFYGSGNLYQFNVGGTFRGEPIQQRSLNYNLNANTTVEVTRRLRFQYDLTYTSRTVTAQGFDTDLLLSNAGLRYTGKQTTLSLQLTNLFNSNVQSITTQGATFFSATECRKYDRVLQVTVGLRLNDSGRKLKATKTDYGEKDF